MIRFTVDNDEAGGRLDNAVVLHTEGVSRSYARYLCEHDKVLVNGKVKKAGHRLHIEDTVQIDYDPVEPQPVPDIDLPILYEDEDCFVVNKPLGVLTHSKGVYNPEATVATFAAAKVKGMAGERAGIVHRLDRATSGVMIVAKTPEALSWLQKQFSLRKVKKTYMAVIHGELEPHEAIIDMPIERNPKKPQTFRVGPNGKPAVTHYETISKKNGYSLLKLSPTTGRTHQLRVHLKKLGFPILGDTLYEGEDAKRLFLHAHMLEITLPNRSREVFTAPLPPEFKDYV